MTAKAIDTEYWKRLDALLAQALALPLDARTDWLLELAPEDEPFRARLAEMLARSGAETDAFMKRPVDAGTLEQAAGELTADKAGDIVGPWRLVSVLGFGGMGAVWRVEPAEDSAVRREVALKLPRTGWSPGLATRLARECDILSQLEHPNIARLYDAGFTQAGRPWLAMEIIDGVPIDQYCRDVPLRERLRLFLEVARAISYAHARLIVHRDLKPSNILVDPAGRVHVVDFGLGKVIADESGGSDSALTQTLARALTPDYASPEQIRGGNITVATDVYSLGVVLYQLLADKRPYRLKRESAAALEEAIVEADVPPPSSQVDDRARARALRGDLDTIIAKALRKDPNERYATVEAFAIDVDRHLRGLPVHARPPSFAYTTGRFIRRHRTLVGATVMVVLALVAGLAGTLYQGREAAAERDRALRELRFAEAAEEFMRFLLSEQSVKPLPASELLQRAERSARQQFADDPALRARMQLLIADLYGELADYKRAEVILGAARSSAEIAGDRWLLTQADCVRAGLLGATGRNKEALAIYARVMPPVEANPGADPMTTQICYSQRSITLRNEGRSIDSANDARAALASMDSSQGGYRVNRIFLKTNIADSLTNAGKVREAVAIYEQALAELGQIGRGGTSAGLLLASNLIVMLTRAGQPLQAIAVYGKVATGEDPDPPTFTSLQANYARVLFDVGRSEEGEKVLAEARRGKAAMGDARGEAIATLTAANVACHYREDAASCDALREDADRRLRPMLPPKHSTFATLEFLAGRSAMIRGDMARARPLLEVSVAMYDDAPDRNLNMVRALSALAAAQQATGEAAAAKASAARAVEVARRAATGFDHSEWLGSALVAQAAIHLAQGDEAGARTMVDEGKRNIMGSVGPSSPAMARLNALSKT